MRTWEKYVHYDNPLIQDRPTPLADSHPELIQMSPFELFTQIVSRELMEYLAEMTNLYAEQKLHHKLETNADELMRFILAVVAAWRLHCHAVGHKKAKSHLEFRREIVITATKTGLQSIRDRFGGPTAPVLQAVKATAKHFLVPTTQGRCVLCMKNTTKKCDSCQKRLHEKCFPLFHKSS